VSCINVNNNNNNNQLTLYDHVPERVETSKQVQTYRTIPNNKPDIIIHDNKK